MVAAEEIGIPLEMITTKIGDTNDPQGPMSGGSTTIGTVTPAARLAAHHAKKELLEVVAVAGLVLPLPHRRLKPPLHLFVPTPTPLLPPLFSRRLDLSS